jgi:hypothetical protein
MGAWGTNFFESEWDWDLISDFSGPAGLAALAKKAKMEAEQGVTQPAEADATNPDGAAGTDGDDEDDDDLDRLSLYAGHCADIDLVREHLNAGVLRKLIDEWRSKMETRNVDEAANMAAFHKDYYTYQFVLLGACAMSLGCKIPDDFKELLIEKYRTTNFGRDALHSMQLALGDGPGRYKDLPYDFESKGLVQMANAREAEDDTGPGLPWVGLNVPVPFLFNDPKSDLIQCYPANVCGGCGAKDRLDGEPLLSCSKCKVRKYCGKVCQQAHFKQHKRVCEES